MGKQGKRSYQASPKSQEEIEENKDHEPSCRKITEKGGGDHDDHDINCDSTTAVDSAKEDSTSSSNSLSSSTSSDLMEDATSFSSSSSSSNGPLYQLSDLMAQLPLKRGLSKYYQGKSQSFTSLANVESLEDLAKKENPCKKKIKLCKSYCGGLDGGRLFSAKKATISNKASPSSRNHNNLMVCCRPPHPVPVHKYF
ncbi:hypothetical protein Cgig2_024047 [Carnegiea gigantea]|uniref:Oxidative stress 3 n=1 Tax=Carnegiea gigantea TaxID=171969 RepID=A0A9Q1KKI0_9CARY|nr:hypothetical protein Cgig2_024047 [Carnegiea gigantea]